MGRLAAAPNVTLRALAVGLRERGVMTSYYNEARTHLSLGKDAPAHHPIQCFCRIISAPRLGSLHHQYCRIKFAVGTAHGHFKSATGIRLSALQGHAIARQPAQLDARSRPEGVHLLELAAASLHQGAVGQGQDEAELDS
jgi:hypothetical protein